MPKRVQFSAKGVHGSSDGRTPLGVAHGLVDGERSEADGLGMRGAHRELQPLQMVERLLTLRVGRDRLQQRGQTFGSIQNR